MFTSIVCFRDMIHDALKSLKDRNGSSRQAIMKYITANYKIQHDERTINNHLKLALRAGVKNGTLKQSKGTGASGSFKIGEEKSGKSKKAKSPPKAKASPKKKPAKPKKVKKPKAKAEGGEKKAKKKPAKKPKSPKKAVKKAGKAKKKSPKKAAKK